MTTGCTGGCATTGPMGVAKLGGGVNTVTVTGTNFMLRSMETLVMIRTLQVMGLVPPQYVITSYRFRLFPLFPLLYYYPILVTPRLALSCDVRSSLSSS